MEIKNHSNSNITINLRVDKTNHDWFLKELKKIGKEAEYKSNANRLNYFISSHFQKIPYARVGGICSRVVEKSGEIFEVLFLDVDLKMRWLLESECQFLIKEYNLSPFYLFTTCEKIDKRSGLPYGNYHAISISKMYYKQILEMQSKVHTLDPAYSIIPRVFPYSTWVLRQSVKGNRSKPRFVKIIGDINKTYSQNCSNSHRLFIEGVYPEVPKIKYINLDKHLVKDLFLTDYLTASNVEEKE
jgi:hypothetical protein